ncbi:MAG TPA: hypothetical protein VIH58_13350 [Chthoniobacterales bacterium]
MPPANIELHENRNQYRMASRNCKRRRGVRLSLLFALHFLTFLAWLNIVSNCNIRGACYNPPKAVAVCASDLKRLEVLGNDATIFQVAQNGFRRVQRKEKEENPMMVMEKKYKALRVIATIFKILAFVLGILCLLGSVITLAIGAGAGVNSSSSFANNAAFGGLFTGFLGAVVVLVYGVIIFLYLYAMSEFIHVFLDIEENTRLTNHMLSASG